METVSIDGWMDKDVIYIDILISIYTHTHTLTSVSDSVNWTFSCMKLTETCFPEFISALIFLTCFLIIQCSSVSLSLTSKAFNSFLLDQILSFWGLCIIFVRLTLHFTNIPPKNSHRYKFHEDRMESLQFPTPIFINILFPVSKPQNYLWPIPCSERTENSTNPLGLLLNGSYSHAFLCTPSALLQSLNILHKDYSEKQNKLWSNLLALSLCSTISWFPCQINASKCQTLSFFLLPETLIILVLHSTYIYKNFKTLKI